MGFKRKVWTTRKTSYKMNVESAFYMGNIPSLLHIISLYDTVSLIIYIYIYIYTYIYIFKITMLFTWVAHQIKKTFLIIFLLLVFSYALRPEKTL